MRKLQFQDEKDLKCGMCGGKAAYVLYRLDDDFSLVFCAYCFGKFCDMIARGVAIMRREWEKEMNKKANVEESGGD